MSLFFGKTLTPQNGLLILLWKETHSETQSWKSSRISTKEFTTTTVNLEIVEDFACEDKTLEIFRDFAGGVVVLLFCYGVVVLCDCVVVLLGWLCCAVLLCCVVVRGAGCVLCVFVCVFFL